MSRISAVLSVLSLFSAFLLAVTLSMGAEKPPAPEQPAAKIPEKKSASDILATLTESASTKDTELFADLSQIVLSIENASLSGADRSRFFSVGGPVARIRHTGSRGIRFCFKAAVALENSLTPRAMSVVMELAQPSLTSTDNSTDLMLQRAATGSDPELAVAAFGVIAEKRSYHHKSELAYGFLASSDIRQVETGAAYLLTKSVKDGVERLVVISGKLAEKNDAEAVKAVDRALRKMTFTGSGFPDDLKGKAEAWKKWWDENSKKAVLEWVTEGYKSAKSLATETDPEKIRAGFEHLILVAPGLLSDLRDDAASLCYRVNVIDKQSDYLRIRLLFVLGDPSASDMAIRLIKKIIPEENVHYLVKDISEKTKMFSEFRRVMEKFKVTPQQGLEHIAARYLREDHAWQAVPHLIECLKGEDAGARKAALGLIRNHFDMFAPVPWDKPEEEKKLALALVEWLKSNMVDDGFLWYVPTSKWLARIKPYIPGYEPEPKKKKQPEKQLEEQPVKKPVVPDNGEKEEGK